MSLYEVEKRAISFCRMKLNALLMCRNQQSLRVLAEALDELEIAQEVCLSAPEAMELLVRKHYSALVLDFDIPAAAQVARIARMAAPQKRPVVFAIIGAMTPVSGAFQAGVNFVLYRPLEPEPVSRSLRAGQGFMRSDRRRAVRQQAEALVYLRIGMASLPAIVLDISEQGLALQAPEPLPPIQKVPLRFVLPGTGHLIEATGEVIWKDDSGRAGMFFTHLSPAARKHLKLWLRQRGVDRKDAVRVLLQSVGTRPGSRYSH